jgi:nuclear pore complex protein Nup93
VLQEAAFPRVQRDILQVEQYSQKLRSRAVRADASADTLEASRLLANEGLNPRKLTQALQTFELRPTYEDVFQVETATVEEYLQQVRSSGAHHTGDRQAEMAQAAALLVVCCFAAVALISHVRGGWQAVLGDVCTCMFWHSLHLQHSQYVPAASAQTAPPHTPHVLCAGARNDQCDCHPGGAAERGRSL